MSKQFWRQINFKYDQQRFFWGLLIQWSASAVCCSGSDSMQSTSCEKSRGWREGKKTSSPPFTLYLILSLVLSFKRHLVKKNHTKAVFREGYFVLPYTLSNHIVGFSLIDLIYFTWRIGVSLYTRWCCDINFSCLSQLRREKFCCARNGPMFLLSFFARVQLSLRCHGWSTFHRATP